MRLKYCSSHMNKINKSVLLKKDGFTLFEILVVVAIIGIVIGFAIPNINRSRQKTQTEICSTNIKEINSAKSMWAMWGAVETGRDVPQWADIVPEYVKKVPICPGGGVYAMNDMDESATCSVEEHKL